MDKKDSGREASAVGRRKRMLIISGGLILLAGGFFGAYVWHWEVRPHVLEAHVFLADTVISVFIRTPDNHTILIDGGKTGGIMRSLTSLMPFYRRAVDTVILTKDDDAHAAGLVDVLNRYHVGEVIEMADVISPENMLKIASTSTAYLEFAKVIAAKNIPDRKVTDGGTLALEDGIHGTVSAGILFPPTAPAFKFSKTNLPQLALRIRYGETSFVISDLSKTEQKYAVAAASSALSVLPTANVLIAQHAGGTSAMNEDFFSSIRPDYTVISKKPTVPHASAVSAKKPKKPPFSIFNVTSVHIVNLATDGNAEFISDGKTIRKE
jgi:beta-lactamase superfamily II metal-dependent hydrolase